MKVSSQRILAFSDEVSLTAAHIDSVCKGYEYQVFDSTNVTRDLAAMQQIHGFAIDVASDANIAETISSRYRLGLQYDLIAIYSLRVWQLPNHLQLMLDQVRSCLDHSKDGIRLAGLPVAVMNSLNMVNLENPQVDRKFQSLLSQHELYATQKTETFPELTARAIGTWWLNAICDLRYQGVGLTIDSNGKFSICGAYSHQLEESFYFAGNANASTMVGKAWCANGAADGLNHSIQALNTALDQASKVSPKAQEPILQQCFVDHPSLLAMGIYDSILPEVFLQAPDPFGLSIKPDFIAMNSILPGMREASAIIEIKSPEMRLRAAKKASRQFRKAIEQLGRHYQDYFSDSRTEAEQITQLGRRLSAPKLMLIIGRNAWQDEWLDLRRDHSASEHHEMRIVSYDDVRDFAELRQATLSRVSQSLRKFD